MRSRAVHGTGYALARAASWGGEGRGGEGEGGVSPLLHSPLELENEAEEGALGGWR